MIDGVLACLYLGALWYAAPLLDFTDASLATRFRNLAIFGIAIPLALAFVHLLYAPVLWIIVACLVFSRFRAAPPRTLYETGEAITLAIAVVLAWPAMVRPLLDGDTLLYHLPIAASWVQAQSLWTSTAPYWYYPPGSESFAAGLFCVSGRFALPVAGIVPMMMLVARLYEYARSRGCLHIQSGAIALAFVATPLVAFQVGTLQNDVWLAALFLEVLVALRKNDALTLATLMKPIGWVWGIAAAIIAKVPLRAIGISFIPLIIWIGRDAVLFWLKPVVPIAVAPPYLESTIAGHGLAGIGTMLWGVAGHSFTALIWILIMFAGLFKKRSRGHALIGLAGLVAFLFFPVTFMSGADNYAATGDSLRYAFPALVCGALVAIDWEALEPRIAFTGFGAMAAYSQAMVMTTFMNDGYTLWMYVAELLSVIAVLTMRFSRGITVPVTAAALIILASWCAQDRAPGFYAAYMPTPQGKPTGVFAWLASQPLPQAIVAVNMRPGLVIMAVPSREVVASGPEHMCARATERGALLIVGTNETDDVATERAQARACGKTLYDDGAALVVQP